LYSILCAYHRRIHKGLGGPDPPPEIWSGVPGVRVPVKYPQDPLIKQVLYLYCVMDRPTAENMNVWRSGGLMTVRQLSWATPAGSYLLR